MNIQIFGTTKCFDTKKAQRYFKERGIKFQMIVMAAEKYDPSRINRFVIDLASAFHRFYGSCRIQGADPAVQQARLALCIGVKNVIFNVLTMFKINVPEKM